MNECPKLEAGSPGRQIHPAQAKIPLELTGKTETEDFPETGDVSRNKTEAGAK